MLISVVPIGNSKGIRLPKAILEQLRITDTLDLKIKDQALILRPVNRQPRKGWEEEFKKTRPCLIISPNEMNKVIGTVIIAPMTTKSHPYPTRVELYFQEKKGWIVLDQIRTVDKNRLLKRLGKIKKNEIQRVKSILQEMLVD